MAQQGGFARAGRAFEGEGGGAEPLFGQELVKVGKQRFAPCAAAALRYAQWHKLGLQGAALVLPARQAAHCKVPPVVYRRVQQALRQALVLWLRKHGCASGQVGAVLQHQRQRFVVYRAGGLGAPRNVVQDIGHLGQRRRLKNSGQRAGHGLLAGQIERVDIQALTRLSPLPAA